MPLTQAERAAGRKFRDGWMGKLAAMDSAVPCSPFIREYRHACLAAAGVSVAVRMREHYETSPEYWVCYCSAVGELGASFPHDDCDGGKVIAPAGLFAFIWNSGRCPHCSLAVRSLGRLVLASERPPEQR